MYDKNDEAYLLMSLVVYGRNLSYDFHTTRKIVLYSFNAVTRVLF